MKNIDFSKRETTMIIILLLLVVGYIVYPRIQQQRFEARAQTTIAGFEYMIEEYRIQYQYQLLAHRQNNPNANHEPVFFLELVSQWLENVNHTLYLGSQEHLADPFIYNHPPVNLNMIGFYTNIIGTISIPAIDINLPIYLGANMYHLGSGVAHVTHSSFPVNSNGRSSNTVIAGYRSTPHSHGRVFRDIPQLQIGDEIRITNFLQTIVYSVVETRVAAPYETEALRVQSGRELVTLITTHQRRGNMRYLVVAERVG